MGHCVVLSWAVPVKGVECEGWWTESLHLQSTVSTSPARISGTFGFLGIHLVSAKAGESRQHLGILLSLEPGDFVGLRIV